MFIELLACTGLRFGEAIALQWKDLDLQAGTLSVRRTAYKGELGPPKNLFGLRTTPLTSLPANLSVRVMKPAARAAGVPWASFRTLRHTFASSLFRRGCNVKQVQAVLGHHSPAFTLERYVHLIPEDLPNVEGLY